MLVSLNPKPSLEEFKKLMANTDQILNSDAITRPAYYAARGGNPLEDDVKNALEESAKGTPFAGTIEKVSGQKFPDIVASKLYGVEVKSTNKDHWTSTGSSILETTRVSGVERIYMTFGKLGGSPPEFISKPYEECLYGIAVTHMPRYLINMKLNKGETIFDKMGVPYDELRKMESPIAPVAQYYRSQLKPGESLWWTGDSGESAAPPTVKLWSALSPYEKEELIVHGYVLFPEIVRVGSPKKYNRYALWLVTQQGVVNTNVRDGFSAGGKKPMRTDAGINVLMPAAFKRIQDHHRLIKKLLSEIDEEILEEYWEQDVEDDRLRQWCRLITYAACPGSGISPETIYGVLTAIFPSIKGTLPKISFSYPRRPSSSSAVADKPRLYEGEKIVQCRHCGKKYASRLVIPEDGHKHVSHDRCPYCTKPNGIVRGYKVVNRKL